METYNYQINSIVPINDFIAAIYAGGDEYSPAAAKPVDSAFFGYFNRGHKKFSFGALSYNSYHIGFNWFDSKGNEWQSKPPPGMGGSQAGSSFVVDTFIQTTQDGNTAVKLQAHFNCTIYNGSNSKKVTGGTCVVYFENK